MTETQTPVPENLRGLMEAVQRIRDGEDAFEELQQATDWLLGRTDEVARGLAAMPPAAPDAPTDQAEAYEEARSRFQEGLTELEEGLHLISVFLQEGEPEYLDTGVERVLDGTRSIASVSDVWAQLLARYQPQPE